MTPHTALADLIAIAALSGTGDEHHATQLARARVLTTALLELEARRAHDKDVRWLATATYGHLKARQRALRLLAAPWLGVK